MTPNDLKESGLLVMEVLLLLSAFRWFASLLPHFIGGAALFSAVMVLYLLNTRMDATAKITLFNRRLDPQLLRKTVLMKERGDRLDLYRRENCVYILRQKKDSRRKAS